MWLNFINKDAAWLGNTFILNISPFKRIKDNFQKITKILCELGKITLPLQIVVVCLNGRLNGQDFWGGEIVCWHGLLTEACGGRFCGEIVASRWLPRGCSVISTGWKLFCHFDRAKRVEKSVTAKRLSLSGLRKAPAANGEQEVCVSYWRLRS